MRRPEAAIYPDILSVFFVRAFGESPFRLALAYSVLAVSTSSIGALFDGLFMTGDVVLWGGESYTIRPFLRNYSTVLDFFILNPLVVFYAYRAVNASHALMEFVRGTRRGQRIRSQWLCSSIFLFLSTCFATAHYWEMLSGNSFDSIVTIGSNGDRLVTVGGWIVYFWTVLIGYFIFLALWNQLTYARFIFTLKCKDIPYRPLCLDQTAGVRKFAEPSLEFLTSMLWLLAVLMLFALYDFFIIDIERSGRIWTLLIYVLLVCPLFFIPIVRLHHLMKQKQELALELTWKHLGPSEETHGGILGVFTISGTAHDTLKEFEARLKLRELILRQPTWPIPLQLLMRSSITMAGLAAPQIPSFLSHAMQVITKSI